MLFWQHPLKARCADKYTMRGYVEDCGFGHTLPELLGVYATSSDIDFDALPDQFALKCSHGCGFNILCRNKETLDQNRVKHTLDVWMKTDISKRGGEIHYAALTPRIVCEAFLKDAAGEPPVDYKVYCFGGKAHCTMVCANRGSTEGTRFDFYDRDWLNKLPYSKSSLLADRAIPKPEAYDEIIAAAEALSKPFPFVRMDFYCVDGRALIGEMTFTPHGCIDTGYTETAQQILGDLIELPEKLLT